MAYEHNNQSNGSEGYGSYSSYNGKDEYYLNNYRGSGGGGYRGSRGRGSRGYNNNYYGGRGGGHRSYSNYHDQGNDTAGSSTTSSQNGEYESQDNTQETEHSYSSRPHISGFHRGSYRGGFRGSYRGRGGGSFNNGLAATASPTTTRHYKDIINENKLKNFNNPWINIMRIEDEPTQNKLEKSYNDMTELDSSILELQKSKLKLEMSMSLIEKQIDKEGLHVELTNEKLEEFDNL